MILNPETVERKELTPAQIAKLIADYIARYGNPPALIAVDGGEVKQFDLSKMEEE